MVLGFKTHFPDGSPTNFVEAILSGRKIHSIRSGTRWRKGMSIHMATGVRTKSYHQFCIKVVQRTNYIVIRPQKKDVWVSGIRLTNEEIELLAKNDGLTTAQFWAWFHSDFSGQIIHWTDYRYTDFWDKL